MYAFFISNTLISNTRLELKENWSKAKLHTEADFLQFENYSLSLSTLSSKNYRRYFKNLTKSKYVCFNEVIDD